MARTARKAITERQKIDALLEMAWEGLGLPAIYCLECEDAILPEQRIQWDHRQALCHDGSHSYHNIRPVHYDCHKGKTKRDVQANSKVKRLAKGPRQRKGRKLEGRGFDKRRHPMNQRYEPRVRDVNEESP